MKSLLRCLLLCLFFSGQVLAFEPFVIEEVDLRGLQRIEPGTVFSYVELDVGQTLDSERAKNLIKTLYGTGFFDDIQLLQEQGKLIVMVQERPTIADFSIKGNKDIPTDELTKNLERLGLAKGRIFNRSLLDVVSNELRRQYFANGKYSVEIETKVTEETDNRVVVAVKIVEGDVAKISHINIVGNQVFNDKELGDVLKSRESTWWRFLGSKDKYSKERLAGDLEALTSFYQDRGYLKFSVDSTQVSLSSDNKKIYITINVTEGDLYTVGKVGLLGELILEKEDLEPLLLLKEGELFSRQKVTSTVKLLGDRLGIDGFAFAKVNPIPEINEETRVVNLNFLIDPGQRVYVRRINFTGNAKTRDDVYRREMRQFEGGWYSTSKVARSRTRLARLPFVEDVQVNTEPVSGTNDLVDIDFTVKERSAGTFQIGFGYSGDQGFNLQTSVSHSNFFGTGQQMSAEITTNESSEVYSFSFTDPYFTSSGVSRTLSAFYRETDALTLSSGSFSSNTFGGTLRFAYPVTEYSTIRLGTSYRSSEIVNTTFSSTTTQAFVAANGNEFDSLELELGWGRDTRNRSVFATRGSLNRFTVDLSLPVMDLEFYKLSYRYLQYFPLHKYVVGSWKIDVRYGEAYGDTSDLPPYEKIFGGGMESVRGFDDNSLGPQADSGSGTRLRPVGGNASFSSQSELIFPGLTGYSPNIRLSLFVDAGNVFAEWSDFDSDLMRSSAGIAFRWLTPVVGMMKFSLSKPLREFPEDDTEVFSFSFGSFF